MFANEFQNASLLLWFGLGCHRKMEEGDVIGSGEGGEIGVVGHNQGHLNAQLSSGLTEEEVIETMANFGHHDEDARLPAGGDNVEVHGERLGGGLKVIAKVVDSESCVIRKMHAHEEPFGGGIAKLRRVDDVQVPVDEEFSDGIHNTGAIGAGEGEDEVGHGVEAGLAC